MKIKYSFRPGRAAKTLLALSFTATLLATAPAARADSPSDLLEQGIYSEQTKGDLDGAMQLYQKVIAQVKSNQALAPGPVSSGRLLLQKAGFHQRQRGL